MDWSKATKKQLITIMNYDRECPRELIKGAVTEMLERGILNDWIMTLSRRYFGIVKKREIKLGLEDSDIIQLGYIGIWKALDKYIEGKSAFSTFSAYYMNTEWTNHLSKFSSLKRTGDKEYVSIEIEVNEKGNTLSDLIPSFENVEKAVVMKVYFESQINKLTPLQRKAVLGYMQGYQMKEIAQSLGLKRQSLDRAFHRAVEKMGGERISLKENCGMRGA